MNPLRPTLDLTVGRAVARCPACGSIECATVGATGSAFDSMVGAKIFQHPPYEIRYCGNCGLYFKSCTLANAALGDYYTRLEPGRFEKDGNFPTDKLVAQMLQDLPSGSKVLDFGCSTGRILKTFTSQFECYGVEINEAAAAIARQRGIRILPEDTFREGRKVGFDAILLMDIYEHLLEPVAQVGMLIKALNPGGIIAIVCGNAEAVRPRDHISEFWYFRLPGHFQMISERHVEWLAERLGMSVISLDECSHYDTPWIEKIKQCSQTFAYYQFKRAPKSILSTALRFVPVLNRARYWTSAPALNFMKDHFVAVYRKS